jgi:ribonuclease BN (tRNA processing enzyme)
MATVKVTFLGTGGGNSIHREHTAIVVDCADGTRLLLDASSGNSVLRQTTALGMNIGDFDRLLLTHHHPDHMSGLLFLQFRRASMSPELSPLRVYATEEAMNGVKRLCGAVRLNTPEVNDQGAYNRDGRQVLEWAPTDTGQAVKLGPTTQAYSFAVDHIPGAVGWRIESGNQAVVFSGDTRYSENLAEAAQGARLLIHEAIGTDLERDDAVHRGHSTGADAGRVSALAEVDELILTHIDTPFNFDPSPLSTDAGRHYSGPIGLARDLLQVEVGPV